MLERDLRARVIAKQSLNNVKPLLEDKLDEVKNTNALGKPVLCYVGDKLVGEYDSLTKCATALGMSRNMVKKAIDNGVVLENGFLLKLK